MRRSIRDYACLLGQPPGVRALPTTGVVLNESERAPQFSERKAPRFSLMRREKCAALVLAAGYEVWPGVHLGYLPAFQIALKHFLAVLVPIGVST